MSQPKNVIFQTFAGIAGNSESKVNLLKQNRRKMETEEVFNEVRKELSNDLDAVVETVLKLKNNLGSIDRSQIG